MFQLNIFTGLQNVEPIQLLTALGVIITIVISYSSLNKQRRASARESLEQLDDIRIRYHNAKIKSILHRYSNWPFRNAVVKLQMYQWTEIAGMSQIHQNFMGLPRHVFNGYSVEVAGDGYLVELDTANAVEIRKQTQKLLQNISQLSHSKYEGNRWVPIEDYQQAYGDLSSNEGLEIFESVLSFFDRDENNSLSDLKEYLRDEGYNENLAHIVVSDLKHRGKIKEEPPDSQRYIKTADD